MDSFSWISAQSLHAVVWVGVIYIGLPDLVHGRRSCSCFWRRPSSKCWWIYQTNLRFTDEMEPLCSERNEKSQWMCCDCLQRNNVISHLRSYIRRLWIRYHSYPIAGVLTLFFWLASYFWNDQIKTIYRPDSGSHICDGPGVFSVLLKPSLTFSKSISQM